MKALVSSKLGSRKWGYVPYGQIGTVLTTLGGIMKHLGAGGSSK